MHLLNDEIKINTIRRLVFMPKETQRPKTCLRLTLENLFFSFCYVNTYWKVLFLVVAARKWCQCQINNTAKIVCTPWRSWIGIVIVNGQKQEGMTISSHLLCCLLCQMAAMLWHISLYDLWKLQCKLEKKIAFTNVHNNRLGTFNYHIRGRFERRWAMFYLYLLY